MKKKKRRRRRIVKRKRGTIFFRVDKLKWNRWSRDEKNISRFEVGYRILSCSTIDNYHRNWREYAKNGVSRGFGRHYGGTWLWQGRHRHGLSRVRGNGTYLLRISIQQNIQQAVSIVLFLRWRKFPLLLVTCNWKKLRKRRVQNNSYEFTKKQVFRKIYIWENFTVQPFVLKNS